MNYGHLDFYKKMSSHLNEKKSFEKKIKALDERLAAEGAGYENPAVDNPKYNVIYEEK